MLCLYEEPFTWIPKDTSSIASYFVAFISHESVGDHKASVIPKTTLCSWQDVWIYLTINSIEAIVFPVIDRDIHCHSFSCCFFLQLVQCLDLSSSVVSAYSYRCKQSSHMVFHWALSRHTSTPPLRIPHLTGSFLSMVAAIAVSFSSNLGGVSSL